MDPSKKRKIEETEETEETVETEETEETEDAISINQSTKNNCETSSENSIKQIESDKGDFDKFPNEIFDKIFSFIPLNDLASIGVTCKSMKQLTESYFIRKVNYRPIKVGIYLCGFTEYSKVYCWNRKKYESRFGPLVNQIDLYSYSTKSSLMKRLFEFVNKKCCKEIEYFGLTLHDHFPYREIAEYDIITDQIRNLKMAYFYYSVIIANFLKKINALETLILVKEYTKENIQYLATDWITTINPNLKVFILVDVGKKILPNIDLTQFLSNSPLLQVIGLNIFSTIRHFLNSGRSISHASFWFSQGNELLYVIKDIERACEQNRFSSLELGAGYYTGQKNLEQIFNGICHLPNIQSLHVFPFVFSPKNLLPNIHLKTLCFRMIVQFKFYIYLKTVYDYNDSYPSRLIELFPNLEELHFSNDIFLYKNLQHFKNTVKSIANQAKHLKRMNLIAHGNIFTKNDLIEINTARSKLDKASHLIIQIDCDEINTKLEFVSTINSKTLLYCAPCKMYELYGVKSFDSALAYLKTLRIK